MIAANKLFEVQKYVTLTNHQYNPQSVLISKKFWDTLSPAEKKIISDAAVESTIYQRQQARLQATTALETVKKGGMKVTELSPAEVEKLREKMRPVIAKFAVSRGPGHGQGPAGCAGPGTRQQISKSAAQRLRAVRARCQGRP